MTFPTLVLMPGLHGTRDLFKPLLAHIPATFPTRIIAHPTDVALSSGPLLARVENDLADLRSMVLIAESFSGHLAVRFAAANPDRVRGLVLCVSFVTPPVPRVLCYLATAPVLLRCPLPGVGIRTFLSGFRAPRHVVRELRKEVNQVRPWVLAHRIRQAAWVDARNALRACTMPILCLAGKRDRLVGRRSVRRMLRIRPDLTVKWLDAPHLMLQVKSGEAWREISAFVDGCTFNERARASEAHGVESGKTGPVERRGGGTAAGAF